MKYPSRTRERIARYADCGRIELSVVREQAHNGPCLRSGHDVYELFRARAGDDPREQFLAFYLDSKHCLIASHIVSIGAVQAAPVHPREVFGPALLASASAIIVAHNHPSGDPAPSADDRLVTERLRSAGELLGVNVLDHVVIGHERFYSFADEVTHAYRLEDR